MHALRMIQQVFGQLVSVRPSQVHGGDVAVAVVPPAGPVPAGAPGERALVDRHLGKGEEPNSQ